jgi:hypothetical protein
MKFQKMHLLPAPAGATVNRKQNKKKKKKKRQKKLLKKRRRIPLRWVKL